MHASSQNEKNVPILPSITHVPIQRFKNQLTSPIYRNTSYNTEPWFLD